MTRLNNSDYIKILNYYNKPIPKSNKILKMSAEKILSLKLCRCIKKINTPNEGHAIGICTKTIFNRKGFTRGKFTCKGKYNAAITKKYNAKNNTKRTRRKY